MTAAPLNAGDSPSCLCGSKDCAGLTLAFRILGREDPRASLHKFPRVPRKNKSNADNRRAILAIRQSYLHALFPNASDRPRLQSRKAYYVALHHFQPSILLHFPKKVPYTLPPRILRELKVNTQGLRRLKSVAAQHPCGNSYMIVPDQALDRTRDDLQALLHEEERQRLRQARKRAKRKGSTKVMKGLMSSYQRRTSASACTTSMLGDDWGSACNPDGSPLSPPSDPRGRSPQCPRRAQTPPKYSPETSKVSCATAIVSVDSPTRSLSDTSSNTIPSKEESAEMHDEWFVLSTMQNERPCTPISTDTSPEVCAWQAHMFARVSHSSRRSRRKDEFHCLDRLCHPARPFIPYCQQRTKDVSPPVGNFFLPTLDRFRMAPRATNSRRDTTKTRRHTQAGVQLAKKYSGPTQAAAPDKPVTSDDERCLPCETLTSPTTDVDLSPPRIRTTLYETLDLDSEQILQFDRELEAEYGEAEANHPSGEVAPAVPWSVRDRNQTTQLGEDESQDEPLPEDPLSIGSLYKDITVPLIPSVPCLSLYDDVQTYGEMSTDGEETEDDGDAFEGRADIAHFETDSLLMSTLLCYTDEVESELDTSTNGPDDSISGIEQASQLYQAVADHDDKMKNHSDAHCDAAQRSEDMSVKEEMPRNDDVSDSDQQSIHQASVVEEILETEATDVVRGHEMVLHDDTGDEGKFEISDQCGVLNSRTEECSSNGDETIHATEVLDANSCGSINGPCSAQVHDLDCKKQGSTFYADSSHTQDVSHSWSSCHDSAADRPELCFSEIHSDASSLSAVDTPESPSSDTSLRADEEEEVAYMEMLLAEEDERHQWFTKFETKVEAEFQVYSQILDTMVSDADKVDRLFDYSYQSVDIYARTISELCSDPLFSAEEAIEGTGGMMGAFLGCYKGLSSRLEEELPGLETSVQEMASYKTELTRSVCLTQGQGSKILLDMKKSEEAVRTIWGVLEDSVVVFPGEMSSDCNEKDRWLLEVKYRQVVTQHLSLWRERAADWECFTTRTLEMEGKCNVKLGGFLLDFLPKRHRLFSGMRDLLDPAVDALETFHFLSPMDDVDKRLQEAVEQFRPNKKKHGRSTIMQLVSSNHTTETATQVPNLADFSCMLGLEALTDSKQIYEFDFVQCKLQDRWESALVVLTCQHYVYIYVLPIENRLTNGSSPIAQQEAAFCIAVEGPLVQSVALTECDFEQKDDVLELRPSVPEETNSETDKICLRFYSAQENKQWLSLTQEHMNPNVKKIAAPCASVVKV